MRCSGCPWPNRAPTASASNTNASRRRHHRTFPTRIPETVARNASDFAAGNIAAHGRDVVVVANSHNTKLLILNPYYLPANKKIQTSLKMKLKMLMPTTYVQMVNVFFYSLVL